MKYVISYIPDWKVFIQALIVFGVPFLLTKFFDFVKRIEEK